jgi:hypothetical protein
VVRTVTNNQHEAEALSLARKPNYDFEKRRKEMDRKAKKDAKRDEKLRRKEEGAAEEAIPLAPTDPRDAIPVNPDQD